MRWPLVVVGGVLVYGSATYAGLIYFRTKNEGKNGEKIGGSIPNGACGSCAFDRIAGNYDRDINWDETVMGINLIRWYMFKDVKGDVLEISAGTGRNLPYYNLSNLRSLTLVDASDAMLRIAKEKYKEVAQNSQGAYKVKTHFVNADASKIEGISKKKKYDYVIDTFGLCSHEDPVSVLKAAADCCDVTGEIILLEHGQGHYNWINDMLNDSAKSHFCKWGCWWNRNINEIIEKADLDVVSCWRWHFGTTYVIRAKPKLKS